MPNLERLREVGREAAARFDRIQYPAKHPPYDGFRIYRDNLKVYIAPRKAPRTELVDKIRQLRPHRPWNSTEEPTHAADFDLYRRVLNFVESLGFWVGHIKEVTHDKKCIWHPLHHDAAHVDSRLRLAIKLEHNGSIQIGAYQDGLVGPGRKNGPRHSIETHYYKLLGHREQLWWRYLTWRLRSWLLDQEFLDNSEAERHDHDAYEWIEARVRASWHFKGEDTIFTPRTSITNPGRDDRDVDGRPIVNGQLKCVLHRGRFMVGQVFYNLNNMWWVVLGGEPHNHANFELADMDPFYAKARRWMPVEKRLARLRRLQAQLVENELFERAAKVRDLIKGHELEVAAKNDRRRQAAAEVRHGLSSP